MRNPFKACGAVIQTVCTKVKTSMKLLGAYAATAKWELSCRFAAVLCAAMPTVAYASGVQDLEPRIENMANEIYGLIVRLSTVIAGVVIAWCLLSMLFSKDERKVANSMDWLKRAAVCWVCIFLVSTILRWMATNLQLNESVGLDGVF